MYENRIAKAYVARRDLLRSTFPTAHEFLLSLEERSAPVVWLSTGKSAHVYWQDGFLLQIRFVGIGEANTGIRLQPNYSGKLIDGTEDRCGLLFPEVISDLIEAHGGYIYRWASRLEGGIFELRHPAPGKFFRELQSKIERIPVEERALRLTATLAEEFEDEPASDEQPAPTTPAPPPVAAAPKRPPALRPSDTNRLLTIEHLVDTYLDWAVETQPSPALASRLEAMEQLFCCRLPRLNEVRGPTQSDRARVIQFAWRCATMHNDLGSPFTAAPDSAGLFHRLWDAHSLALGTPIEALRRACREAFKGALLTLFPGIDETIIAETDVEVLVGGDV